jgi:predicted TIM-barrel fold metal-dependent hydrolase
MIQKYPDRFIFGSDWKFGRRDSFEDYTGHIRTVRRMLEILAPGVQRKVLYENARCVYSID